MPCTGGGCPKHTTAAEWVQHFSPAIFGHGGCPHCGFLQNTITGEIYTPSLPCPNCGHGGALARVAGDAMTGIRVIWPSDIREAKQRVNAEFNAADKDVADCQGISADEKSAWALFVQSWKTFYGDGKESSIFGLGGQMDDIERYEMQLYEWKKKLEKICSISGPIVRPTPEGEKPILPPLTAGADTEAIKWIAIAGAIGVAAWMFAPAIRGIGSRVGK
jgi:hypothetical protein